MYQGGDDSLNSLLIHMKDTHRNDEAIYTIGHSNHPIEVFLGLLKAHSIQCLADVRTIPRSRYNPQFNQDALEKTLQTVQIAYVSMKSLGGLRHAKKDSVNGGWKNASFRGYADYMQSEAFEHALEQLITLSKQQRTVIMCAESVPWRCHRSLIADALSVRHISVCHILSQTQIKPHQLTEFAHVKGKEITYPPIADLLSRHG